MGGTGRLPFKIVAVRMRRVEAVSPLTNLDGTLTEPADAIEPR